MTYGVRVGRHPPVGLPTVQRWAGLGDVPRGFGPCVVTIGVFDGVHRGHCALVARAVRDARDRGIPCVAMTFDPHPLVVVAPDHAPAMLATVAHRLDALAELGVDATLVLAFDTTLAAVEPATFVTDILIGRLNAAVVVVGANFTFGRGGAGTVDDLVALGGPAGIAVDRVELVSTEGDTAGPVSASRIRTLLGQGEVEQVTRLLGRPFRADGVVVRGEQRGRALGYPTANIDMAADAAVPADGVYAGRVFRLAAGKPTVDPAAVDPAGDPAGAATDRGAADHTLLGVGAISVGTNPTFDGRRRTVEAFILDFDADLYGDVLGVEFAHRLRGMVRFDSVGALITQMDADVGRARALVVLDGS